MAYIVTEESKISKFLFSDTKMSWFWLIIRVYVGWQWLSAGYEKIINPDWVGGNAGPAMTGFIKGALAKTIGAHPSVSGWYAWFLTNVVQPNIQIWSHAIAFGELLVGLGLILGGLTVVAAFFGMFMNLNFLLAGTTSINPQLLILSVGIIFAKNIAGYIGVDRFLKSFLSKSWHKS